MRIQNFFTAIYLCVFLLNRVVLFSQTPPTPTITMVGSNSVCARSADGIAAVRLISSSPYGNIWLSSNVNIGLLGPPTTQTLDVFFPGTYSVIVVNGTFTSTPSAPVTISLYYFPHISVVPVGPVCRSSPPIMLVGIPPGGVFFDYISGVPESSFTPANANIGLNNFIFYKYIQMFDTIACLDTSYLRIEVDECNVGIEALSEFQPAVSIYQRSGMETFGVHSASENINAINIINAEGKPVINLKNANTSDLDFDLENYPCGIYVAEVKLENHLVRLRFVKTQ